MESSGLYFNKDKEKFKDKVQTLCKVTNSYYYCKGKSYFDKHKRDGDLGISKEIFVLIAPVEMVSWNAS